MVRVHLQAQLEFWYSWCVRWSEKPEECDSISTDSTIDFVAQLVELFTFNEEVMGSSPIGITHRVIEESGLSRFVWDEEHAGSNPAYPTHWNIAQLVRAFV